MLTIGQKDRKFTLDEANQAVKIVHAFTQESANKVKILITRMDNSSNENLKEQLEAEITQIIDTWQSKVEKLGGNPKGLWLADFDNGSEYYCWKFPETEIHFSHGYNEGFLSRKATCNCAK